jgi:hypothetical protein
MSFDHCSFNKFFGFPPNQVLPYICIDNPLVYTKKAKSHVQKYQNGAWDSDVLKSLMFKFEISAEELQKLFYFLQGCNFLLTQE